MSEHSTSDSVAEKSGSTIRLYSIMASVLTLLSVAWALEVQLYVGLYLFNEQFLVTMLGIALAAVFIGVPARTGATKTFVPWYDWVLRICLLLPAQHLSF